MPKFFFTIGFIAVVALITGYSSASARPAPNATVAIHLQNKITPEHIELGTTNNILYLCPPEPSFTPEPTRTFFGLSSPKYPGVILRFIYSGVDYEDNDSMINAKHRLLKKVPMARVNNYFNVWAYKITAKAQPATYYTWLIFIDDDISYIQGTFTYPAELDATLGPGIERTIASIVNVPNPALLPKHSVFCDGDYSIIGLEFVPQVKAPVAYFTEDARPFRVTGGSRMFAVASPPVINRNNADKIPLAVSSANQILELAEMNDSVVVERIAETEINGNVGYEIRGSLQRNSAKRVVIYYADDVDDAHFILLGLCDAKDEDDFFGRIDKFRPTLKRHIW